MGASLRHSSFRNLAVASKDDLVFGVAPKPVRCGLGLTIGAGSVYPEVNFTLPIMNLADETWPEARGHYEEIVRDVVLRALRLKAPGFVLEFELLPAMTVRPEWGAELTDILKRGLAEAHDRSGLICALRVTPTDIREMAKPPLLRIGEAWDALRQSLELNAEAGRTSSPLNPSAARRFTTRRWFSPTFPGSSSRSASFRRATWRGSGRRFATSAIAVPASFRAETQPVDSPTRQCSLPGRKCCRNRSPRLCAP